MANRVSKSKLGGTPASRSHISGSKASAQEANEPIDTMHLSRQSLGDQSLERELLVLFDRQAAEIATRLRMIVLRSAPDLREALDFAHMLKGSALIVGAQRVAKAAEALELALKSPAGSEALQACIGELDTAVEEAGKAIEGILAS